MWWNQTIELDGFKYGGLRIYPYQLAFGLSIAWYPTFMLKLYFGFFRIIIHSSFDNL